MGDNVLCWVSDRLHQGLEVGSLVAGHHSHHHHSRPHCHYGKDPMRRGVGVVLLSLQPSQLVTSFAEREQKAYASAGTVAGEVLSSIRTVVAFGAEEKEARR